MIHMLNKKRSMSTLFTMALGFFLLLTGCQDASVRHYNRAMDYLNQDQYDPGDLGVHEGYRPESKTG